MKPLFSEEEKIQAVRTFLIALQHKKARITSYLAIRNRINSGQVVVLCKLNKSEKTNEFDYQASKYIYCYSDADAKVYFEWLVSAVSGTLPDAIGVT